MMRLQMMRLKTMYVSFMMGIEKEHFNTITRPFRNFFNGDIEDEMINYVFFFNRKEKN